MKTIKQEDANGCGVACVAMLTGVEYDEAREVIYPTGRSRLTNTKDLRTALKKLGRKPMSERRQPFGPKTPEDLTTNTLIFVKMGKKGKGNGHWVVWDAEAKKIRDPDPSKRLYKIKGYLAVE
jgi:ABC-type bacteriocin/lantibiotic exporter with double-glycine peptidase domain